MLKIIEQLIAAIWNWLVSERFKSSPSDLVLGNRIRDGQVTKDLVRIPENRRSEHIAILGKTGTGKSSLLKHFVLQDIQADRGFVFFDLHGDAQGFLVRAVAEQERQRKCDLSHKLIIVEPADPHYSVGLNVLEHKTTQQNFVQTAEIARILKQRFHLEVLGPRTEELLRSPVFVLSENHLTLLELPALLTNFAFRSACVKRVSNADVQSYFENRYDPLSDSTQATFREPVLNKITAFTADPHFRHILGQPSSVSPLDAMDNGYWILLNLDKGRLGEQASTLGSLFLTKLKNAIFARRSRKLFTLYCDELQNLVTFDSGLDTLLSEARKFAVSMTCANQFLEQYPPQMRAAILAVGTHILFQLSSDDATKMAMALGGGKHLGELLRHLPHREMLLNRGQGVKVSVPEVPKPPATPTDLYDRCRKRWTKLRSEIERDIRARMPQTMQPKEVLDDWN